MNRNQWAIGIVGSLIGFIVSQALTYYTFRVNLESTRRIQTINLARELTRDFFNGDAVFKDLRMAIESCGRLYKSWGGKFTHDQINRYLGFFEDLGFYNAAGMLDLDIINHLFGSYLIEAFEYNELRKYIENFQKNSRQSKAFVEFQTVAQKLEALPERKELIELARRGCVK